MISKEEARRAWEELGRREQDERDRMLSLKNGRTTYVGGVEVVPMLNDPSRTGTQPSTRDGQSMPLPGSGSQSVDPGYTTYDPARSDTDTDPFTEAGRSNVPIPPLPTGQAYQQTSNTSSAAMQAARGASGLTTLGQPQSTQMTTTTTTTTTAPAGTRYPASSNGDSYSRTQAPAFYQHEGTTIHDDGRVGGLREGDERSYVPSVSPSVSELDYELDSNGEVRHDAAGNPIVARHGPLSDDSDEYNVQRQQDRERSFTQTYGSPMSGVEYGSGPTSTAPADYEGRGYGAGWEAMPRHHHPTRLSDVQEEDEISRTSPSRASQASRGVR